MIEYLDHILARNAVEFPDAEALRWPGGSLSYAALDERVSRLADALRDNGIGVGTRVGIYLEKSEKSVISAYSVMRVGAAYVPLDPAAPIDRVKTILLSCELELVITESGRHSDLVRLWETGLRKTIDADANILRDTGPLSQSGTGSRTPSDPAYILYTSGTTGTPKGIVHTHTSGLAYVTMAAELCALTPQDRVSHHTPLHFDMSVFDIFCTAFAGACAVILPTMYTKLPASLSKLAEMEQITVWYSVPHALVQLVERGVLAERDLSSLRIVMFAGEKILPGQLKRFADFVPKADYLNAYGPSETNHCTTETLSYGQIDGVTPIKIGLPSKGVNILVEGEGGSQDEGELLVASNQIMQGYWNDHERTSDCIREVTSDDGSRRRYYATGDLVRRLECGSLELIGRVDRQIKLRGYRIELDEVELAIAACPGVSETAVLHRATTEELVAFVCPRAGFDLNDDELRASCARILPLYAVPARFVITPDLLRTSTGKIDWARLAEIENG